MYIKPICLLNICYFDNISKSKKLSRRSPIVDYIFTLIASNWGQNTADTYSSRIEAFSEPGNKTGLIMSVSSSLLQRFIQDRRGSVATYSAIFSILALSAGSISVDLGRLITLKAQMQHRADAGATAAAVYLDGTTGARERASDVARFSSTDSSNISRSSDLTVATVTFYSEYSPTKIEATGDDDASIVEVRLEPKLVDFFFTPFFGMLMEAADVDDSQSVNAWAVAQAEPLMCHAPPLMACDPTEEGGTDLMDSDNAGVMMMLKAGQGSGPMVPGNFGSLETGYGAGANNVERALADIEPPGCTSNDVTTEPGNMANKVRDGMNARFNGSSWSGRAPNVQEYPRDSVFEVTGNGADGASDSPGNSANAGNSGTDDDTSDDPDTDEYVGDGDWDPEAYWEGAHDGDSLPDALADASRYQVYLYEAGETFDRDGKKTIFPVDTDVPTGYTRVDPVGDYIPEDGEPDDTVASNGALRRVVEVAILQCIALDVRGRGTYSTDGKYIAAFVTEQAGNPPNSTIYVELIGRITPSSSENYHANARIIE
jgi:hypothetical protein